MPALGETLDRTLVWTSHTYPDGRYVRTAKAKDGSLLVESFLDDRAHAGGIGPERTFRAVCIPASIASAVVEGMRAGLAGDENGEANE